MKGIERHMFPGGNTSKGFYSFYRYIISVEEARRIICIKGGPGTGKSSLMKKVGTYFNDKGFDIEYQHCSSDNNSLDGIVIKRINVAILDGTAPHVVDPVNPGAVDEILNMGDNWNEEGFKKYRKDIIDQNKEIGKTFKRAYRYLGAAKIIHDDWSNFNYEALSTIKLNKLMESLKDKIFGSVPLGNTGFDRHMFATAFTPSGIITYVDTLYKNCEKIYILNGGPGTGKTDVLNYLSKEAINRGFYVEIFHDPLIPERIEHIIIPELKTSVLTSNEINKKQFEGVNIYMDDIQNKNLLVKNEISINNSKDNFYLLLNKSLEIINSAKKLHDQLETYYIPNMNFDKVADTTNKIIDKIEKYQKEL